MRRLLLQRECGVEIPGRSNQPYFVSDWKPLNIEMWALVNNRGIGHHLFVKLEWEVSEYNKGLILIRDLNK